MVVILKLNAKRGRRTLRPCILEIVFKEFFIDSSKMRSTGRFSPGKTELPTCYKLQYNDITVGFVLSVERDSDIKRLPSPDDELFRLILICFVSLPVLFNMEVHFLRLQLRS